MPFTYILECADRSYYVGSTARSPLDREAEHNLGLGAAYTRIPRRRPARLVWFEEYADIADAAAREKQIQRWGRAKRIALIDGRIDDLRRHSRSYGADGGWGSVGPGLSTSE